MKTLIQKLNMAAKAYYSEGESIMSDKEYDALYDKLVQMERETGIVLPDSPTRRVGYEVVSSLPKVEHEVPALSLDKTKDVENLKKWMEKRICNISWKMDGLTAVATYRNGRLRSLVTRGNGIVGEDVTHNAKYIKGLPNTIPYYEPLIVRGEVVISYSNFKKINEELEKNGEEPYSNPRNLASGSLRLLDTYQTAKRCLEFKAFTLVNPYVAEGNPRFETVGGCFVFLKQMGFDIVQNTLVMHSNVQDIIDDFTREVKKFPYPVDGLVLTFEKIDRSIGTTGKYPKYAMAFKWQDTTAESVLRKIEWSASKTGLLNPVAVFDPVQLEGTTVGRASLHNLSMIEKLKLHVGDHITIYKANMIIPQIDQNLDMDDTPYDLSVPDTCPACGGKTEIHEGKNHSLFLTCINPDCPAKHLGQFERAASREALNIIGLSTFALEKFISMGYLHELADLFHLSPYQKEMVSLEGMGEKMIQNLLDTIEKARTTTFRRMFYALGIPGAGKDVAKILDNYFSTKGWKKSEKLVAFILEDMESCLDELDGIGPILAKTLKEWFSDTKHQMEYQHFIKELHITDDEVVMEKRSLPLQGLTFVITGSVSHYPNRNALKAEIESLGGKVSGSVSKKTSYLINNDVSSTSGKNKKALELGIPILSEEDYLKMLP